MGQPVAAADCSSFARPSWAHAPGETRTIKATIAKRVVAAPQSARLRDGIICAFYNRRNRTGRSGPRQGRAERRLWRIGCRGRTIYGRRVCLHDPVEGDSSRTSLCRIHARGVSGMAQAQDLRQAITSMAGRPGPLLSALLSVNAEIPENQRRAYLIRLRDAMNDQGVPEGLQHRVREYMEEETHPRARTLAVFADEDDLFEIYRLQVDVPESARWGDPNVGPLTLVLDEYEPYGAAVLDAERFRYFVVSPLSSAHGEEETKANGFREIDVHPSEPYPRGGGSTDLDPAGRKQQSNIHDFYKQLGDLTRDITFREGVQRLILAGPKERTAEFR